MNEFSARMKSYHKISRRYNVKKDRTGTVHGDSLSFFPSMRVSCGKILEHCHISWEGEVYCEGTSFYYNKAWLDLIWKEINNDS